MNPIIRGALMYFSLFIVFRLAGKRTLAQANTFDLVLLLIISEVTQQALVGSDFSLTASMVLILTLVGIDLSLSLIKNKWKTFEKITESTPLILVEHGRPLLDRMRQTHVSEDDVLEAARKIHGLVQLNQIKYAVLERDADISIIPEPSEK
jgi:uncharacterized membrane protein YcaP (DUF421 family)